MKEEWRDIIGYEGLYQVSNLGRVKNKHDKILKQQIRKGYCEVGLYKNNSKQPKLYKVHRLVAESFILNPNNLPCVNHKDENKKNNKIFNLEWCNHNYNDNYGTRNEKISKKQKCPIILQCDKNMNVIKEWNGMIEIYKKLGYHKSQIYNCCIGKYKTAHNYIWKYKLDKCGNKCYNIEK